MMQDDDSDDAANTLAKRAEVHPRRSQMSRTDPWPSSSSPASRSVSARMAPYTSAWA
jgi:hypothetical protein